MDTKKAIKFFASLVFCNFYRFLKIFPNNDPIMGFALPFARSQKLWQTVLFVAIAMVSFDLLTSKIGFWTLGTAGAYALVVLLFHYYFKRRQKIGLKTYAGSAILGVLIFDFLTGPIMSSFLFKMPFAIALFGQIPFTIMHLASATAWTIILAPVLDPAIGRTVNSKVSKILDKAKPFFLKQILKA